MTTHYVLSPLLIPQEVQNKNAEFLFLRTLFSASALYKASLSPCSLIFTNCFETDLITLYFAHNKSFLKKGVFFKCHKFKLLAPVNLVKTQWNIINSRLHFFDCFSHNTEIMKILNALQLKAYKLYFSNYMNSWKKQLRVKASGEL